jgi:hypothetical protein
MVAFGPGLPGPGGDVLGAGAFVAFLVGASLGLPDFSLIALLALTVLGAATLDGFFARTLGSRRSFGSAKSRIPSTWSIFRFWWQCGGCGYGWDLQNGRRPAGLGLLATVAGGHDGRRAHVSCRRRPVRSSLRDRWESWRRRDRLRGHAGHGFGSALARRPG